MLPGAGSLGDCHTALDIISTSAHLAALTLNTNNDNTAQKPHLLTISIQPHCESYDNFVLTLELSDLYLYHIPCRLCSDFTSSIYKFSFTLPHAKLASDLRYDLHVPHHLSTISSALSLPSHQQ